MTRLPRTRLLLVLPVLLAAFSAILVAQDDPNEAPLGDVARNFRKKTPTRPVIDDDNLPQVMQKAEHGRGLGSSLRFLMSGEAEGFRISAPDVTCSLSFTANVKSLLSGQYAEKELPATDVAKLQGHATIEGEALTVSVLNETDWHVSEIVVAFTVIHKNGVGDAVAPDKGLSPEPRGPDPLPQSDFRPDKKPDTAVIYRMRAAATPWAATSFSSALNLEVEPGDEWHWAIVQAKGYPPANFSSIASQATAQNAPASPVPPATPQPAAEPQSMPEVKPGQTPQ